MNTARTLSPALAGAALLVAALTGCTAAPVAPAAPDAARAAAPVPAPAVEKSAVPAAESTPASKPDPSPAEESSEKAPAASAPATSAPKADEPAPVTIDPGVLEGLDIAPGIRPDLVPYLWPKLPPIIVNPSPVLTPAQRDDIRADFLAEDWVGISDYFGDEVFAILAASECCFEITPAQAVEFLGYAEYGTPPWTYGVPAADLDAYRASPSYGDTSIYEGGLFPEDVMIWRSADGLVVAFGIEHGEIATIFIGDHDVINF